MSATAERRKHCWGSEARQPSLADLEGMAPLVRDRLGFDARAPEEPVPLERVELEAPRVSPPDALSGSARTTPIAGDAPLGKAYRDVVRGFRGRYENPPDVVARPRDESEIEAILAWCCDEGLAAIPYGGGPPSAVGSSRGCPASIRGGVDRPRGARSGGRGGRGLARGPDPGGSARPGARRSAPRARLTMRCYPQSFEFSTLGGWIATRAGGHFATRLTHVDDMVESVRAITPARESRRLPGSGAGPSPDRLLIGSEGILGVITEAWVRVQPRPVHKESCAVAFQSFSAGAEAVRELAQSGLDPSNCRLLDAAEARFSSAGDGGTRC